MASQNAAKVILKGKFVSAYIKNNNNKQEEK